MADDASIADLRIDGDTSVHAWPIDALELVWRSAWVDDAREEPARWELTGVLCDVRGADRPVRLQARGACRPGTLPLGPGDFPVELSDGPHSDEPITESLPIGDEDWFFSVAPGSDRAQLRTRAVPDGLAIELRLTGEVCRDGVGRRAELTIRGTPRVRIVADRSERMEVWPGRSGWPAVRDGLARYRDAFFSDAGRLARRLDPRCDCAAGTLSLFSEFITLGDDDSHPLLADLRTAYFVLARGAWLGAETPSQRALPIERQWQQTVRELVWATNPDGTVFQAMTPTTADAGCAWIRAALERSCTCAGCALHWPAQGMVRQAFSAIGAWNLKALVLRTDAGVSLLKWWTND